jgi:hypothetical protein
MSDLMVLGERCGDLAAELSGLELEMLPGDLARLSGKVAVDGPLMRAMHRAEAELLLADAAAMAAGRYAHRTSEQRRHDAFLVLVGRLIEAASAV